MTASRSRSKRRHPLAMRRRTFVDYLAGVFLAFALVAMAIDHNRQATTQSPSPPARTLTHYPGP